MNPTMSATNEDVPLMLCSPLAKSLKNLETRHRSLLNQIHFHVTDYDISKEFDNSCLTQFLVAVEIREYFIDLLLHKK